MLYVKLDENGNVPEGERAIDFATVKARFLATENTILPLRFQREPEKFGYGAVPTGEERPIPAAGKNVRAGVPIKNADGTFTRTWEQVDIQGYADMTNEQLDLVMRSFRKAYLHKFADSISPLRWNNWSSEQQAEVTAWYNQVLSMPEDPSWPRISFPELPAPIKA